MATIEELEQRIKELEKAVFGVKVSPSWGIAPDWAKFYFVDKHGHSYWLEKKPTKDGFFNSGRNEYIGVIDAKNILVKKQVQNVTN